MSPLGEASFKGFYELLLQHSVIYNNLKIKSLQTCIMKIRKHFLEASGWAGIVKTL